MAREVEPLERSLCGTCGSSKRYVQSFAVPRPPSYTPFNAYDADRGQSYAPEADGPRAACASVSPSQRASPRALGSVVGRASWLRENVAARELCRSVLS